jgi:hypothetical protein
MLLHRSVHPKWLGTKRARQNSKYPYLVGGSLFRRTRSGHRYAPSQRRRGDRKTLPPTCSRQHAAARVVRMKPPSSSATPVVGGVAHEDAHEFGCGTLDSSKRSRFLANVSDSSRCALVCPNACTASQMRCGGALRVEASRSATPQAKHVRERHWADGRPSAQCVLFRA